MLLCEKLTVLLNSVGDILLAAALALPHQAKRLDGQMRALWPIEN
jgi:hypothetical protein